MALGFLESCIVVNSIGSGIVFLVGGFWLWMAHLFRGGENMFRFLSVVEEGSNF